MKEEEEGLGEITTEWKSNEMSSFVNCVKLIVGGVFLLALLWFIFWVCLRMCLCCLKACVLETFMS